jgi:sulfite reductase alpha subunit-like flavoprotein
LSLYNLPSSISSLASSSMFGNLLSTLFSNLNFAELELPKSHNLNTLELKTSNTVNFESNDVSVPGDSVYSQIGSSSNSRNNPFSNPIISYDYKCGHYLGIWDKLYPSLILSFIEVARGVRKSSWIFSDQYQELLKNNYSNYFSNFTSQINLKLSDVDNWYSSHISPMDNYFNFYYTMNSLNFYKDSRWMSFNSMDQKFTKCSIQPLLNREY